MCFTYSFGLRVSGTGAVVERNDVSESPHSGATIHGNNLMFRYNVLHHLTQSTFDNAALYFEPSDWTVWNMTLKHNFAYLNGVHPTACNFRTSCLRGALYMDNVGAGLNVEGNVIWHPFVQGPPVDEWHNTPLYVAFNNDGGRSTAVVR